MKKLGKILGVLLFFFCIEILHAEHQQPITAKDWSDSLIMYMRSNSNKAIECGYIGLKLAQETSDTAMMGLLSNNLCAAYLTAEKYDSAFFYVHQAIFWYNFLENKNNLLWCQYYLGIIYEMKNQSDSAIQQYNEILKKPEIQKNTSLYSLVLANLGDAYYSKSQYRKAIFIYSKTREMNRNADSSIFVHMSVNMAAAYNTLSQYDSALIILQEGLNYAEKGGFLLRKASLLTNLSDTWIALERYNDAQKSLEEAILIREEAGDSIGLAHSYRMMGKVFVKKKEYRHANDYYFKSMKIDESLKLLDNIAATYCDIGECLHYQQNYQAALEYFDQAYTIASNIGAGQEMSAALLGASFTWNALKNPEKSEKYLNQYLRVHDSLKRMDTLNDDYFNEEKIDFAEEKKDNSLIINIFLIASLLLNVIFLCIYLRRRSYQKP